MQVDASWSVKRSARIFRPKYGWKYPSNVDMCSSTRACGHASSSKGRKNDKRIGLKTRTHET